MNPIKRAIRSIRNCRAIERDLVKSGIADAKVRFRFGGDPQYPYHCDIERTAKASFTLHLASQPDKQSIKFPRRTTAVLHALTKTSTDIRHMDFNMSDGDQPSPARFAYCGSKPELTLLPDLHFYIHRGYHDPYTLASSAAGNWRARSSRIRWRGGLNGAGETDAHLFAPDRLIQRLNLVLLGPALPDADFKLVRIADDTRDLTKISPCFGDPIPEPSWMNDRYAIDVDGWTNTWTNFLVRLHYGCCVLKVDSRYGYRQWYYDRIKPWEHFVPVKADMSDLAEKIDWVRANDGAAEEIAMRGQAFARTMTLESEMEWAANAIQNRVCGN